MDSQPFQSGYAKQCIAIYIKKLQNQEIWGAN